MVEIKDEVADIEDDVELLLDEQVIQDQRIFNLEQTSLELVFDVQGNQTLSVFLLSGRETLFLSGFFMEYFKFSMYCQQDLPVWNCCCDQ